MNLWLFVARGLGLTLLTYGVQYDNKFNAKNIIVLIPKT